MSAELYTISMARPPSTYEGRTCEEKQGHVCVCVCRGFFVCMWLLHCAGLHAEHAVRAVHAAHHDGVPQPLRDFDGLILSGGDAAGGLPDVQPLQQRHPPAQAGAG